MIKFEHTSVMNIENAVRGARNPLNSWAKSDSHYDENGNYIIGEKDLNLLTRLRHGESSDRKFIRQIFVCVDITAPLYWWKEYDTYKVATVANSTSTMHTITSKPFSIDDFSTDHLTDGGLNVLNTVIDYLEVLRVAYIESNKDKKYWYDIIELLPECYNQKRTCTLDYETLINIYFARRSHKLDEWHKFCDWIKTLPYAQELIIAEPKTEPVDCTSYVYPQ